jgi:hypothetical protein
MLTDAPPRKASRGGFLESDRRRTLDLPGEEVTSFGTFLSTLCHEFCHHLDFQKFRFEESWHTRGFYERAGVLYHYARGTPSRSYSGCLW